MFYGEYSHGIDTKGRLILPARFREVAKENGIDKFFVTRGLDKCIFMFAEGEWRLQEARFKNFSFTKSEARSFNRMFFSGAVEVLPDKQGRFIIPQYLKDFAGIKKDAVVIGISNRIEIWETASSPYLGRGMFHHVFALSKDKVENTRSAFSLFEELPRRRLEFRIGKVSMPDFFDVNSAGSDTHFQFLNWTVDNNGAWDYAADTRGYTVGATADFEDKNWGLRFGEGLMPKIANGIDLVWKPWQAHAENVEYELRKGFLPKKAGIIRLLGYTNAANMGVYRDQIIKAAEAGTTPDITNHPWHITRKYGFGVNLEQNLSQYLTAFARFGWNDGRTESFAYTEVEQTFLEGVGANGTWWHRKQDRAGVAFVSNAIKKDHQNYLKDGGLGFLLGDGHLNYGRENILETYYTVHLWRGIYVAPGVQHINNPGYNRDRGPVIVPTFRLHVEF